VCSSENNQKKFEKHKNTLFLVARKKLAHTKIFQTLKKRNKNRKFLKRKKKVGAKKKKI